MYEQQRDTFIDEVITKIWAFQQIVFGLGDPSDWKPIHWLEQKSTESDALSSPTESHPQENDKWHSAVIGEMDCAIARIVFAMKAVSFCGEMCLA